MLTNEIVVQSMSSFNSTNFFSKKVNQEKLQQKPLYLGGAKYTLRKKMPIYQSDTFMNNKIEQIKMMKYNTTQNEAVRNTRGSQQMNINTNSELNSIKHIEEAGQR